MKLGQKSAIVFVLGVLIIGTAGFQSYLKIRQLTEVNLRVGHIHQVQENLEHILLALKDAEGAQQGFVLTGENSFLEQYNAAQKELNKGISSAAFLIQNDPQQLAGIQQFKKLSLDKLDELQGSIDLRRKKGLKAVLPVILTGRNRGTTVKIRALIDQMTAREEQLLKARDHDADKLAGQGLWMLVICILFSLVILGCAAIIAMGSMQLADQDSRPLGVGSKGLSIVVRYAFAFAIVGLTVGLRWWLLRSFGPMPIFITFFPGVLLVATITGGGPGILTTLLSAIAADYWFIGPRAVFSVLSVNDTVALGIFTGTGIFLSVLAERMRRARLAETEQAHLQKIFDVIGVGMMLIGCDGTVKKVNDAIKNRANGGLLQGFGVQPGDLLGCVHAINGPEGCGSTAHCSLCPIRNSFESVLRTGLPVHHVEAPAVLVIDGKENRLWFDLNADPLTIDGEKHVIMAFNDITELKNSENQLKSLNENLEQFAYVASHDLQEPLRVMSSYSQLLEKRYKDKLDDDANDFIGFIVDAAQRMQKLITDLLAYSRAGKYDLAVSTKVDFNEAINKVIYGMHSTIEQSKARVTYDKLPLLMAHETSIIQLFQNLISNALKYRGNDAPQVHISADKNNNDWVFSVTDNGIGIEPQYYERIFQIFQRLHSRHEYSGTGIGLSICKKIVSNYGGKIWVESKAGKGSTFYFTIPA